MKWKILSVIFITAVLMYIPYVGEFFKVFNTLFHEGGHAIAALITSGTVDKIELFANTEGVTLTSYSSWVSGFVTSIAGYVFASLVALLFAFLWSKHKHKTIIASILLFSIVNLVLWVRNPYGIGWLILSSMLLGLVVWKVKKTSVLSTLSLVLTLILLTQSVLSSFDILYLSYLTPSEAGDASNLGDSTFLPSLVWGIIFFVQSLVFAFFSLRFLWKTKEQSALLRR